MSFPHAPATRLAEQLLGELTDLALNVILDHGATGASVDIEVDLGRALRRAFARSRGKGGPDHSLAALAQAAFEAASRHNPSGSSIDLELELWHAFRALARTIDLRGLLYPGKTGMVRPQSGDALPACFPINMC